MSTIDLNAVGRTALNVSLYASRNRPAADVLNDVWYAAEGDYVDAAMS